jgi:anhydro-N-acetylmuramic acid kinase
MNDPVFERFIGLMSGTSIDGVDGVLVQFDPQGNLHRTLAVAAKAMPAGLRRQLTALQQPGASELAAAALAANELADLYAACVQDLLDQASLPASAVDAIGAHGQTVRHDPASGYTIQLLNGARLAEASGIDTVADLRSADVAAGGQGAPLVPAFHARVFAGPARRAIVNIGGIANISVLEPAGVADSGASTVIGYDTGPGNTLMDHWCEQHRGQRFDADGAWAATGLVDESLLEQMMAEPYFGRPSPKSTGRDLFNPAWLARYDLARLAPKDVQSTLLELTTRTIADACRRHGVAEMFVCGGGAANGQLMGRLAAALPELAVATTERLGLHPQAVEATAFAWLARQRVKREAGNLASVTGASGPRVLGALHVANRTSARREG